MFLLDKLILRDLPFPKRIMAPVRWFGGKGTLAKKVLPLIPRGKVYVEPYGGAASVLFHREQVPMEVYNDLDGDLVNLFRCLQHPRRFKRLLHRIIWTLYARNEYGRAVEVLNNSMAPPDSRAWALFVAQNQGIGGLRTHNKGSWGRSIVPDGRECKPPSAWRKRMASLLWWHNRLTRVQIENKDALEVIRTWDSPDTVFYLDPPYVAHTRKSGKYLCETNDEHHLELVQLMLSLKGAVILSGYNTPLYSPLDRNDWEKTTFRTYCFASVAKRKKGKPQKRSSRTEVVWRNRRAIEMCEEESRGVE